MRQSPERSCIFCAIVRKAAPALIVYEDDFSLAFLDKHPRTKGHLQYIPKTHYRWIYELPDIGRFFSTAQRIIRGIIPVLGADHVTLATFGQEIHHAHVWIVPQYAREQTLSEGQHPQSRWNQQEIAANVRTALSKEV